MTDKKKPATKAPDLINTRDDYNTQHGKTQAQSKPVQLYFTQMFLWLPRKGGQDE